MTWWTCLKRTSMRFAPPLQGSNAGCKVRTLRVGPRARARVGPRSFDFRDSIFNFRSSCQFVTVIAAGGGSGSTSASADFPQGSHPQGSHVHSHSRRSPPPAARPLPAASPLPFRHQQVALRVNLAKTLRKLVYARFTRMGILKRLRVNLA